MKNLILTAGFALFLLPLTAIAAPTHHAMKAHGKTAATMYQCQKCHMKFSSATAKKDHYKDPMDGGKMVPMMNAPAKGTMDKSMPGMKM